MVALLRSWVFPGILAAALLAGNSGVCSAESGSSSVPVRVAGPFSSPWSVALLADGAALVTERSGHIRLIGADGLTTEITGVPQVRHAGEGGLLDIVVDPHFAENGIVFFSFMHGTASGSTLRIAKAKLNLQARNLSDLQVIFESAPAIESDRNLGGRLAVTVDGYVFLTLGDRREPDRAQSLSDDAGKIIRIRADGSLPSDNPFSADSSARPEIWSFGHRNPQGLTIDPVTGQLWSIEHGPRGGDEINLIRPGRNYGWPVVSHGMNYDGTPVGTGKDSAPGMEPPLYVWVPSIAPSGLAVHHRRHGNTVWLGALAAQLVVKLNRTGKNFSDETRLSRSLGRIRDVRTAADGTLYVLGDGPEAYLYRFSPDQGATEKGTP